MKDVLREVRAVRPAWALGVGVAVALATASAAAQPVPNPDPQPGPLGEPAPEVPSPDSPPPDPLGDSLRPAAGGLTPSDVASHAKGTSRTLAAKRAEIEAAATKVDQALVAYFPILTLSASYTRLSPVENSLDIGITIPGFGSGIDFPTILNQYQLAASLVVPLSDYILRLTQAYSAASEGVEAKRLETRAQELKDEGDAKNAYLNWIRAKGRRVVAELAVKQAQAHVDDARVALAAGVGTRADVLRLEAQVAAAQQLVAATAAYESLGGEQLHVLMHDEHKTELTVGIDVMKDPSGGQDPPLSELVRVALERRVDLQALEASARALEDARAVNWAGHLPRIDAFADLLYANPNPRVFPAEDKWSGTWDVGVRLTWRVNDTFTTLGSTAEADANIAALRARADALRDGVVLEVTSAYYDKQKARAAIGAAVAREQAGEEGLRLRRMQLRAGKAKAADIVDAETELTRARLDRLDSHVDLLAAGVRLEYAMGGPAESGSALRPTP